MAGGDVVWRFSRWTKWWPSWLSELNDFRNSKSPCGPNASHQIWAQSYLEFWSRCGFKIFKIAAQAAILASQMEWFKQFWISMSLLCLPSSLVTIGPKVWEKTSYEEFQDGGHLGYRNGTILAILNLYNALMSPVKFKLNLTCGLGGDVIRRISRWPPWQLSWILEWNNFSNCVSLWCCPSSFGSIQLKFWEEMSFEEFQYGHYGSHLYRNRMILAILNLYVAPMPPIKFWLNLTYGLGGCGGHLGYQNGMILAILKLFVTVMPPIKFWLNAIYGLGDNNIAI